RLARPWLGPKLGHLLPLCIAPGRRAAASAPAAPGAAAGRKGRGVPLLRSARVAHLPADLPAGRTAALVDRHRGIRRRSAGRYGYGGLPVRRRRAVGDRPQSLTNRA